MRAPYPPLPDYLFVYRIDYRPLQEKNSGVHSICLWGLAGVGVT